MSYRYFLKLSFNGADYAGWQVQPNATTVQQLVENGLKMIAGFRGGVTGCGRTDAGVHARVFYAHFDFEKALNREALQQLLYRLNRILPADIVISDILPVLPDAHARYSALWREYEYLIIRQKDPFRFRQAYFVHGDLDYQLMNECSTQLLGRHDFESFSKVHTQVNNFYCNIQMAHWEENGHMLKFVIRADRFLRNMVRAIVGTLLDVGRGKITSEEFRIIIKSHNRSAAGYSVPAKGLSLTGIEYPREIFSQIPVQNGPEQVDSIFPIIQ